MFRTEVSCVLRRGGFCICGQGTSCVLGEERSWARREGGSRVLGIRPFCVCRKDRSWVLGNADSKVTGQNGAYVPWNSGSGVSGKGSTLGDDRSCIHGKCRNCVLYKRGPSDPGNDGACLLRKGRPHVCENDSNRVCWAGGCWVVEQGGSSFFGEGGSCVLGKARALVSWAG